jgi:putative hydrolase of the HAD superfamily
MPPAAVLLDLYDTLVHSDWRVWRDAIAAHIGVSPAVMGEAFDVTRPARSVGAYPDEAGDMTAILEAAGVEPAPSLVNELVAAEQEFFMDGIRLYPDSLPVVRELRSRGTKVVVVSNCSHDTGPVVHRLGLDDEFDALVLSYRVKARKPQAAIYEAALEAAGNVTPDEAIFVDDQAAYCDGAAAVGIRTLLIHRWLADPPEGLHEPNGHRTIVDLTALL